MLARAHTHTPAHARPRARALARRIARGRRGRRPRHERGLVAHDQLRSKNRRLRIENVDEIVIDRVNDPFALSHELYVEKMRTLIGNYHACLVDPKRKAQYNDELHRRDSQMLVPQPQLDVGCRGVLLLSHLSRVLSPMRKRVGGARAAHIKADVRELGRHEA